MEGLRGGGKERFERNEKQKSTGSNRNDKSLDKGSRYHRRINKACLVG